MLTLQNENEEQWSYHERGRRTDGHDDRDVLLY